MLTLKLYPSEFAMLIRFLRLVTDGQESLALRLQSVSMLVLLTYRRSWRHERLYNWKHRRADKQFVLKLPVTVAKAFYDEFQAYLLDSHQQLLLAKLDQAIVNYQSPYAEPHVLGELIGGH